MINPQWLELPMSRANFHGPIDGRAIEVRLYRFEPASVAQLDACPTCDQEVGGFDHCRVGTILSWGFDNEIFSMVILSLPLIQEGQLSVSGERMRSPSVNLLED